MNTKTKFAAALSALADCRHARAAVSQAEARGRGWAIGAGLIGAAYRCRLRSPPLRSQSTSSPRYSYGYRCRYVDRFDQWGNFAGTVKVCRLY